MAIQDLQRAQLERDIDAQNDRGKHFIDVFPLTAVPAGQAYIMGFKGNGLSYALRGIHASFDQDISLALWDKATLTGGTPIGSSRMNRNYPDLPAGTVLFDPTLADPGVKYMDDIYYYPSAGAGNKSSPEMIVGDFRLTSDADSDGMITITNRSAAVANIQVWIESLALFDI